VKVFGNAMLGVQRDPLEKTTNMTNLESSVACRCRAAICAHPNGEACGRVVEVSVPGRTTDENGLEQGPDIPFGICEECFSRGKAR
jgi:hypothetical protein